MLAALGDDGTVPDCLVAEGLLRAQRTFADQHLDRWAERFAERVRESDRSGFYAAWAGYLDEVLAEDARLLQDSERLVRCEG